MTPTAFTDSFAIWNRVPGGCTAGGFGIEGREPAEQGRYPVFVYLVGTGDNYKSDLALLEISRMAAKGYVAASLDYGQDIVSTLFDVDYLNQGFDAGTLINGKTSCAFGPGPTSAIARLCARAKADCSMGIVTSGHSQGSMVASLAKNHDGRVNASVGYATGYAVGLRVNGLIDVAIVVDQLILDGARALPNDRFRVVEGESENIIGGYRNDAGVLVPGPEPLQQVKEVTGMDCGASTGACFRSNGSGYYLLADSETTAGLAGHCFPGIGDAGDCSAGPLDPRFTDGPGAWAMPAHLSWLDGYRIPNTGLDEGLVANWRLDSTSGTTAIDSDDLARNSSPITNAAWVTGVKGNALGFAGGTTRVDVAADPSLTLADSFSVSLWVKPGPAGAAQMLITHAPNTDGAYHLALNANNAIEFKEGAWWYGTYTTSATLPANQWAHVVAVYRRAGTIEVYVNGAAQSWSNAGPPAPAAGITRLGVDSTGGRPFTGALDEVRIYNRALGAAEVNALYGGGTPTE